METSKKLRSEPLRSAGEITPVSDLFSRKFAQPTFVVFMLSVLLLNLNFPDILRLPVFLIICVIGFRSVYATFAVFISSIIIPDSGLGPFTATQLAIVIWLGMWVLLQKDHKFYYSKLAVSLISLLLFWLVLTTLVNTDPTMLLEIIKVMALALIAYHLLSLPNVRPELCLVAIVLPLGLAALPYYLVNILHVPGFQNSRVKGELITSYFSYRSGETRYSIAKQDPNAVSVYLNVALWASINLARRARSLSLPAQFRWLLLLGFFMIPPLIAAESRAGYLVFLLGLLMTAIDAFRSQKKKARILQPNSRGFKKSKARNFITLLVILLSLVLLFTIATKRGELKIMNRIDGIAAAFQNLEMDNRIIFARNAWNAITKDAPVFGFGAKRYLDEYSGGYGVHNTFLDMGVAAGLPGMAILSIVIFLPLLGCFYRNRRTGQWIWIVIIGYLIILPFMASLSIIGDKLFWILWSFLLFAYKKSYRSPRMPSSAG